MAKSKNHTAHNQSYKAHKGGIKKVKATKYSSTRGVSDANTVSPPQLHSYRLRVVSQSLLTLFFVCLLQMDPKFLRNQVRPAVLSNCSRMYTSSTNSDRFCCVLQRYAKKKNPTKGGSSGVV